jgi:hypothetical protein
MAGLQMTSGSREDVRLAARWYEDQQNGLGREFINQVRETFASVSSRSVSLLRSTGKFAGHRCIASPPVYSS